MVLAAPLVPVAALGSEEERRLAGHQAWVRAVAVIPDCEASPKRSGGGGRRAISASSDPTLKVWDLEVGAAVATFTGDSHMVSCEVAPDGRTLVAGEWSGRVHILRGEGLD